MERKERKRSQVYPLYTRSDRARRQRGGSPGPGSSFVFATVPVAGRSWTAPRSPSRIAPDRSAGVGLGAPLSVCARGNAPRGSILPQLRAIPGRVGSAELRSRSLTNEHCLSPAEVGRRRDPDRFLSMGCGGRPVRRGNAEQTPTLPNSFETNLHCVSPVPCRDGLPRLRFPGRASHGSAQQPPGACRAGRRACGFQSGAHPSEPSRTASRMRRGWRRQIRSPTPLLLPPPRRPSHWRCSGPAAAGSVRAAPRRRRPPSSPWGSSCARPGSRRGGPAARRGAASCCFVSSSSSGVQLGGVKKISCREPTAADSPPVGVVNGVGLGFVILIVSSPELKH